MITNIALPEMELVFLRKLRSNAFVISEGDLSNITNEDIVACLPKPNKGSTKRIRGIFNFEDVSDFYV